MSAWMISGAVLSDFIPPPDSGAVPPGTSGWEEGNLLLPIRFSLSKLVIQGPQTRITSDHFGALGKAASTISLGLKLLLHLVHNSTDFKGRKGEPEGRWENASQAEQVMLSAGPVPMAPAPPLGLPRGGFHCIITRTVLPGSLSPVSLHFVGEKVEGVFPGLRTHAGLARTPFFLHVT